MQELICPNCQKVYDSGDKCSDCGVKLVPLRDYLKEYENKIQNELDAIQTLLQEIEETVQIGGEVKT